MRKYMVMNEPGSRFYNIHGLITFAIVGSHRTPLLGPINWEFAYFENDEHKQPPDIVLNLGKFTPSINDCYLVDNKYFVGQNYLYCADSSGRGKWNVEIDGFDSGYTTVNFNGYILGKEAVLYPDLLAQDLVLKPLLEYKLNKRNVILLHAAAVCRDNQAYLLAGRGGSQKTTLAMRLIQESNFRLMSDDQIIVHRKSVLSFPKHIAQLNFKFQHMRSEDYGLLDKLRLIFFLRDEQYNLKIPRSAKLKAIVLISRSNSKSISVKRVSKDTAVKRLTLNNMIDMNSLGDMSGLFLRYMQAYSFIFPHSTIANYWYTFQQRLSETLSGVPSFEMQIPMADTSCVIDEFERLVENVD